MARKPLIYRVAWPAELLMDVRSWRRLTDAEVRTRAERIARAFLDDEDGCDVQAPSELCVRVYVLGPKAYRETDGYPGDFAVVGECRSPPTASGVSQSSAKA
jgi:hypothetical protein